MSLEEVRECRCVSKHVPLPLTYVTVRTSNMDIELCPTAHANLMSLLSEYDSHGGLPPGSVRKHYSEFIQTIAQKFHS